MTRAEKIIAVLKKEGPLHRETLALEVQKLYNDWPVFTISCLPAMIHSGQVLCDEHAVISLPGQEGEPSEVPLDPV